MQSVRLYDIMPISSVAILPYLLQQYVWHLDYNTMLYKGVSDFRDSNTWYYREWNSCCSTNNLNGDAMDITFINDYEFSIAIVMCFESFTCLACKWQEIMNHYLTNRRTVLVVSKRHFAWCFWGREDEYCGAVVMNRVIWQLVANIPRVGTVFSFREEGENVCSIFFRSVRNNTPGEESFIRTWLRHCVSY
jgi:hypothetical protein